MIYMGRINKFIGETSMKNKKDNWTTEDLIDKDGYYRHHECGTILFRVGSDSNISDVYIYCKKCRKEIKIREIINGKLVNQVQQLKLA